MKNSLFPLLAALVVLPAFAQGDTDISIPEFRQSLMDFAMNMDSAQGPQLARIVQGVPDSVLLQWYQGVPNGRRFQSAVASIRANKLAGKNLPGRPGGPRGLTAATPPRRAPAQASPLSGFSAAGITTVVPPDFTLPPAAYPSGANWGNLTNTLQGVGALPSGDVSTVRCDPDQDATMSVLVSTFHGIKDAAEAVCNIIPDPVVIVLGEGTAIPAKEICFGIALIVGAFSSAIEGYFADCERQTSLVNDAEYAGTYANTISLANLEFRLMVEENLQNATAAMGIFQLPILNGGYLEYARAVTADIIARMTAVGINESSATLSMTSGDTYYNSHNYKQAYKLYQKAYATAVQ